MALTRGASAALINSLKGHFCPVLLTEADWPGEMIRVHSGHGSISWDSKTWLGAGKLVQFRGAEESGGLATADVSIQVAATVEDMLAERGKVIRNRSINVWFCTTTEPGGNVLVADPVLFFTGYFDSRKGLVARDGENLSHDMVMGLGIGPEARASASLTHTYESQIAEFPGDTAGRLVQNADKNRSNRPKWPQ